MKTAYIVTGATRGFGKFVHENLGGFGLTRQNRHELNKIENADTIVHCAYDKREAIPIKDIYEYLDSNIFLTKEALQVPHRKFVFLSTINVYPPSQKKHHENEEIDLNKVQTIYGVSKLMCEAMVKKTSHLILRCSGLLGKYSENNLTKLIDGEELSLSGDSEFNFILYGDVLNFIKKDRSGIYNIVSPENIRFSEIAKMLNKNPQFGNYNYQTGKIDYHKWGVYKTSREVILQFISDRQAKA